MSRKISGLHILRSIAEDDCGNLDEFSDKLVTIVKNSIPKRKFSV